MALFLIEHSDNFAFYLYLIQKGCGFPYMGISPSQCQDLYRTRRESQPPVHSPREICPIFGGGVRKSD